MQKLMTKKQIKSSKVPTRLSVYRERMKRNALNREQKNELYRLERGFQGEKKVLESILEYGEDHWYFLTNLWLYEFGSFEIDLLLITLTDFHTIEVKNFDGDFEYANSQCFFEGRIISKNPIAQAQKTAISLQNILQLSGFNANVNAALIFTGSNSEVTINDPIDGLNVRTMNQLRKFVREIAAAEKEKLANGKPHINIQKAVRIIEKSEIENPYPAEIINKAQERKMRKGIMCANCGAFNINTSKSYLVCDCGLHEPREMAIVRTICEYGVIYFERDLVSSEVQNFFGKDLSKSSVKRYLNQYFARHGQNRSTRFDNIATPFKDTISEFSFKQSMFMRIAP